jgi:uncharacterized protein YjbI with pentapeptide repeats
MINDCPKEELRAVHASEILNKIQEGKDVEYDCVIVRDDLNLKELDLPTKHTEPTLVKSKIKITNSKISGVLTFKKVIFEKEVDFSNTQLSGKAFFNEAIFSGYAGFNRTKFNEIADFSGATFGYANFEEASFGEFVGFLRTTFANIADFSATNFSKYAGFNGAKFSLEASFNRAIFSGNVHVKDAIFCGKAGFHRAIFREFAYFNRAKFNGIADFSRSRFDNIADFNAISCKGLYLDESRIYLMHLSEPIFEKDSTMSLRFSDFSSLDVQWEFIKKHLDYDGHSYLSLIRNFRDLEQFEDADNCYYQYRRMSQYRKNWYDKEKIFYSRFNWSKLYDYIAWCSCGYGVRPSFVLGWILGLIIIFGVLFWVFAKSESIPNGLFLSAMTLTTSMPGNITSGNNLKYALVIERILGTMQIGRAHV